MNAVAALEELERRSKPEQVLGFFSGTVVRFIALDRYKHGLVVALIAHLSPQILGKGFFPGFGSAHVPRLIPTDLRSGKSGHFFVAYAHGLPLSGYSLSSAIMGVLTGIGGHVICGNSGAPSDSLLLGMASMKMAGVAAECVYQGFSTQGCRGDVEQFDEMLREHRPNCSANKRAAY
ncbi:hypothetical protein T492DRAFT_905005 [Pavlovales sp. CCMP2436]|nr:hypothetical protein T492DRAFT_905005 [Pavlovales sp. CCMP2436]